MRNKYVFIIILLCLCMIENKVLAGDYVARITGNYSPQDSLIIGEISKITDKSVEIKVVRIVVGKVCKTNILLQETEKGEFEVGDEILLSVKFLDNELYKCNVAYGHYKVKIKENKKVEVLFGSKNSAEECFAVELQWFVNTGKELSQNSDGFYCAKLLGENELVYDTEKHKWFKNSFEKKYFAPNRRIERGLKIFLFAIGAVGLVWCIQRKQRIFKSLKMKKTGDVYRKYKEDDKHKAN